MSGLHTVTSKLMLQATILLLIYSGPVLAESNAESWSKSTGALFGMAALCGHPPSDQWIKNVVREGQTVRW
jgi:hypothetical protein